MKGHTKIIEARIAGKKPPFVFINDYPCKTDWFEHGDHSTVCTDGDSTSSIDLRFLVGLRVSIGATTEQRATALFEKAKAAGALTVAACHIQKDKYPQHQSGWAEVWHKG